LTDLYGRNSSEIFYAHEDSSGFHAAWTPSGP
jgi:hypothetical protein